MSVFLRQLIPQVVYHQCYGVSSFGCYHPLLFLLLKMESKRPCYRSRFICNICKQSLGYSAFRRHQDLPHLYCPGYTCLHNDENGSDSDSSRSIFDINSPPYASYSVDGNCTLQSCRNEKCETTSSESESESDSINNSGPEVWDDSDDFSSESEAEVYLHILFVYFYHFSNCVFKFLTEPFYCHSFLLC